MQVQELIGKLQTMNGRAEVIIDHDENGYYNVDNITTHDDGDGPMVSINHQD